MYDEHPDAPRMLIVPPQTYTLTAAGQLTTSTLVARISRVAPVGKLNAYLQYTRNHNQCYRLSFRVHLSLNKSIKYASLALILVLILTLNFNLNINFDFPMHSANVSVRRVTCQS